MTMDMRQVEREAIRNQEGTRLELTQPPDAHAMGAESAQYTKPTLDPQWIDAWKMFLDENGNEYGVPVKLPRGQWDRGGPNALMNLRRPDGGYWFTLVQPASAQPEPQFPCFVGECRKRLHRRIHLVQHVRTFHFSEAEAYKSVLVKIEEQVAQEDPRLQFVLESLKHPEGADESAQDAAQEGDDPLPFTCEECGKSFASNSKLAGHRNLSHKESRDAN